MFSNKHILKSVLFIKWLATYIIIVTAILSLVFAVFLYWYSSNDVKAYNDSNAKNAEALYNVIEGKLKEIKNTSVILSGSYLMQKLMNMNLGIEDKIDYNDIYDIRTQISKYININSIVEDAAIIFPYSNKVLSEIGLRDFEVFFGRELVFSGKDFDKIMASIKRYEYFSLMELSDVYILNERKVSVFPVVMSLQTSSGMPRATLIVLIKEKALLELVSANMMNRESAFIAVDNEAGSIFGQNSSAFTMQAISQLAAKNEFSNKSVIQDGRMKAFVFVSKLSKLKYGYIFGEKRLIGSISEISVIVIMALLIYILCIALISIIAFKNFMPIYAMMRNSILNQLINGRYSGDKGMKVLRSIGINTKGSYCQLVLFDLDCSNPECSYSSTSSSHLIHDALHFIDERFKRSYVKSYAFLTDNDKIVVLVINDMDKYLYTRDIAVIVGGIREYIHLNLKARVYAVIGKLSDKIPDFGSYYKELLLNLERGVFTGNGLLYQEDCAAEVDGYGTGYYLASEREVQLINFLRAGDSILVGGMISEIRESNRSLKPEVVKKLLLHLIELEQRIAVELKLDLSAECSFNVTKTFYSTEAELWNYVREIYEFICGKVQERNNKNGKGQEGTSKADLIDQILRHVSSSYDSKTMSLKELSIKFKLPVSILSDIFKKATGVNFLEYVSQKRIEQSKNLIGSTEKELKEIAEAVGYDHYITFNRVFNKYEGISPTKYRSLIRKGLVVPLIKEE